jgi:uncharacterized protein with beta-barrel porin domain
VNGKYAGVSSNFAFLTPSLSYDANDVYLTLFMTQSAFAAGARTANQRAVGTVLDRINTSVSGDLDKVLDAIASLDLVQGPAALDAISGQQYADFGTVNIEGASLFMNAVGQQMALARGAAADGQRLALAEACESAICEDAAKSPWSVWASGLGGLGSVEGDGNAGSLAYSFGGAAAGIDYRVDPRILVGIGTGYTHSAQSVGNFAGQSWTDSVAVAAYGSFTQAGFYADALAGYAYSDNQMQRTISIPGLQPRTAHGGAGANQVLGQVETGYEFGIWAPARARLTPFARLQASSVVQNGFTEWGADSLDLVVKPQTTNALRTTFGAELSGSIGLRTRTLDLDLRLGWQHELADTARPITASFTGAPFNAVTVHGATPQRDSAAVGFQARTRIAETAQLYLRYDGEVGGGTGNHAFNLGLRLTW